MEANFAKKYKNGLCCVIRVPAIERFGGRISELQSLAENEWSKSIASPRKKKGGSGKRPASEDDSDQTSELVLKIREYLTIYPKGYAELSKSFPLDSILLDPDSIPNPSELADQIESAFWNLPEPLRTLIPPTPEEQAEYFGYQAEATNRTLLSELKSGGVVVNYGFRSRPSDNQKNLLSFVCQNDVALSRILQESVFSRYQKLCHLWAVDYGVEVGEAPFLPSATSVSDLDELWKVDCIHLSPKQPLVGFVLKVAWISDENGGMGILMDRLRVLEIGSSQCALVS